MATFENFDEGPVGVSFVDPLSGIIFSYPFNNASQSEFNVEYGGNLTVPPVLPGNCLTGGGYSPGPTFGLGAGFGFTFTLPTPSTHVEMDAIYNAKASSDNITFTALSSTGQLLFRENVTLPAGSGLEVIHPRLSSATPMGMITVSTPGSYTVGFDNIAVPEPAWAALLVMGAGIWLIRRR